MLATRGALAVGVFAAASACSTDKILKVEDVDVATPASLSTPTALPILLGGAVAQFHSAYIGTGNNNESSNPANDSSIKGAEAPGDVDKKKFSKDGNWGNLPTKEQIKVKSDLNRNFPSHYGRAIDQYFRKQSERAAKNKP